MRKGDGYAYLWTLGAVAMLGVGLAAATEMVATLDQRVRERELLSIGRQFREALHRYHQAQPITGMRQYPASLEDLLQDPRFPVVTRHLRKIFVDPMTGDSRWGLVRVDGRIVAVHSLSDRTPIKQAGFDPDDTGLTGRQHIREWVFGPLVARPASSPASGSGFGSTR
jgi:hypothetical protein